MSPDVEILYDAGREVQTVPVKPSLEQGSRQIFVREKEGFARREIETGPVNGAYRQGLQRASTRRGSRG